MASFPEIVLIIWDYADVFDATMICLAMFTLNVFHPGIYLRGDDFIPLQPALRVLFGKTVSKRPSIRKRQYSRIPSIELFPLHLRYHIGCNGVHVIYVKGHVFFLVY